VPEVIVDAGGAHEPTILVLLKTIFWVLFARWVG